MITATARLLGTITATAVIFSTQVGNCAAATAVLKNTDNDTLSTTSIASGASANITAPDATITVNSAAFDTVPCGDTLNVQVKNNIGSFVGALFSGFWRIANSQVNIQNSLSALIAAQAVPAEALATYTIPDVNWTDSDGGAESTPYNMPIVCTPQVKDLFSKFTWESGEDTTSTVTIDADSAGTYTSISDDGASGTITIDINSGGYGAFANPTVLAIGDTVSLKRTTTTALGWAKITGTYV